MASLGDRCSVGISGAGRPLGSLRGWRLLRLRNSTYSGNCASTPMSTRSGCFARTSLPREVIWVTPRWGRSSSSAWAMWVTAQAIRLAYRVVRPLGLVGRRLRARLARRHPQQAAIRERTRQARWWLGWAEDGSLVMIRLAVVS